MGDGSGAFGWGMGTTPKIRQARGLAPLLLSRPEAVPRLLRDSRTANFIPELERCLYA